MYAKTRELTSGSIKRRIFKPIPIEPTFCKWCISKMFSNGEYNNETIMFSKTISSDIQFMKYKLRPSYTYLFFKYKLLKMILSKFYLPISIYFRPLM